MNPPTTCPDSAALEALLHGELLPTEEGPLSVHLEECVRCQVVLKNLVASGASWDSLARCLGQTPPPPEAALQEALGRIAAPTRSAAIRVFPAAGGWKLADELKVGAPVFNLTAPRGEAFRNEIVANALRKEGPAQYVLDAGKDQFRPVTAGVVSSADAAGNYLLMGGVGTDYQELLRGGRHDVGESRAGHLFAAPRPGYWFDRDAVWAGMPPQLAVRENDTAAVPDLKRGLVYFVGATLVKARLLKPGLPEAGSRPVQFPASYAGPADDGFLGDHPQHRYLQHVAVTTGGRLHLYLLATNSREVYYTRMAAFDDKPTSPSSGSDDAGPPRAVEGREFTHKLPSDGGRRTFELVSGPEGLTLDAAGTVRWLPGKAQVGSHEVKARVTAAGKTSIERFPLEVLDKDLVAAAGGDPARVGGFTRIELAQNPHRLTWGLDRKNVLLLQGRRLDVLSADGGRVERSLLFERYCEVLAERPDYYVGMSPLEVRLLDKRTGATIKAISLAKYRRLHDLAVHPTRKVTYVALENTAAAIVKNRADWQRVVAVDEESGNVTELDGVFGRFLAVDPRGLYLYTGFKDIYTQGINFHINPGGRLVTFPDYGNIDILFRFRIDGADLDLEEVLHDAGGNGNGLALAPDGGQIAYLSNGGFPSLSRNVVLLGDTNFKDGRVTLATNGKASCMSLAYHPVLPLAACPGGPGAVFFDRRTGKESPNRLKLTARGLGGAKVEDLMFSADGMRILFVLSEPGRPWYVRAVPLNLSAEEKGRLQTTDR